MEIYPSCVCWPALHSIYSSINKKQPAIPPASSCKGWSINLLYVSIPVQLQTKDPITASNLPLSLRPLHSWRHAHVLCVGRKKEDKWVTGRLRVKRPGADHAESVVCNTVHVHATRTLPTTSWASPRDTQSITPLLPARKVKLKTSRSKCFLTHIQLRSLTI